MASCVGYLDDAKPGGFSEITLGLTDLAMSIFVCAVILNGHDAELWLPFISTTFALPFWLAMLIYAPVVWMCINAINCSDGVDGVSGALSSVTIFALGSIHYIVVGDVNNAEYLLVPFRADAANWALASAIFCGAIIGYLWHNAPPSAALMGDAGSRPIGLFIGMCIVVSGNPATVLFVAPLLLLNGATGLVKVGLIRVFGWRILDTIRFPFHDHARKNLQWSNSQVLLRFLLIHLASLWFLLTLLIKVR
ncbi:MraY family glycosyltransferase [Devosia sp. A369]